jgi:hypothetical protein
LLCFVDILHQDELTENGCKIKLKRVFTSNGKAYPVAEVLEHFKVSWTAIGRIQHVAFSIISMIVLVVGSLNQKRKNRRLELIAYIGQGFSIWTTCIDTSFSFELA